MSRANPLTTHDNAGISAWRFKMNAQISSYADCERAMEILGKDGFAEIGPHMTLIHEGHHEDGRDPNGYPSGMTAQEPRPYAVELYSTKIIRYYPDGSFSVDCGGFATPTTRERLAAVCPDGCSPYFHRKLLGLRADDKGVTFAPLSSYARARGDRVLWPLTHSDRINAETLEITSS
jgi:hypothetical protein